jgi:UDP-N-acetylmuramate--alanine ligase
MPRMTRRVITYGLNGGEILGQRMELQAFRSVCTVTRRRPDGRQQEMGKLQLDVPGRHNVLNALGAVTVALELGIPFERVAKAMAEFQGAERRFQKRGEARGVLVVDDYGHHPTEIAAVLAAATAGINRRIIAVFQPHRYSRTAQLLEEFGGAFQGADEIVLTDIYAAGEKPIPGITVEALADTLRRRAGGRVHVVKALEELPGAVASLARPGDLVITLGAGSIGAVGDRILAEIHARAGHSSAGIGGER